MTGESQERASEEEPRSAERSATSAPAERATLAQTDGDSSAAPSPPKATFEESLPELLLLVALIVSLTTLTVVGTWLAFVQERHAIAFITKNTLPKAVRHALLFDVALAALLALAAAGYSLYKGGLARLPAIRDKALRLAPLSIIGFSPLIVHYRAFLKRELLFLVLLSLAVVLFQKLTYYAQSVPPLALEVRLRRVLYPLYEPWARPEARRKLPLLFTVLGAAAYAAFFAFHTIENHLNLGTSAFDLGLEESILWNILHGGPLFKSSPLGGPNAIHFGSHATLFSFVIVPFYALYQHAETLLVFQAVVIGAAAVPLFLFARRHLSDWAAFLLAVAYLMSPAVQGSNLYDFHYPPLAPFFVWLALYALDARMHVLAAIAIALTLSIREDIAAGVVIVGLYLLFWQRRVRAGLLIAAVGAVYFVLMKLIIMPLVAGESKFLWIFKDLLPKGEGNYGGVIKTVVTNPIYTASTLLVKKKLVYALQIFAPLAFVPLRRSIGWVCALPGFFFLMLSTRYEPTVSLGFQYTAHWTIYLFLAIVVVLKQEREKAATPLEGQRRQRSLLAAIALGTLLASHQFGVVFQQEAARAGFDPVRFGRTDRDRERLAELREIVQLMPPDAKVAASERTNPHVSNREDAYRLSEGLWDAEYLLFDLEVLRDDEKDMVYPVLRNKTYGVVARRGRFVLAQRGAPTDRNKAVLRAMR